MRKRISQFGIAVAVLACVAALAGCGGSDSGASPLDNALGYLPEDAPFAVAIDTNTRGAQFDAIGQVIDRFPFGEAAKAELGNIIRGELGSLEEIEPLLGNEFVIGGTDARAFLADEGGGDDFVGAIQARSREKLEQAVKVEDAKKLGDKAGAELYEDDDGDLFAIEEEVLIVADSRARLEAALEQREAEDRLTEARLDDATRDLPGDALVRVFADLEGLLASDPDTKSARNVDWVNALRTFGAAASLDDDGANVDFRLNTDPDELGESDLPFATGSDSPSTVEQKRAIAAGVRDAGQIVAFVEDTLEAIDPETFGNNLEIVKRGLEQRLGVSIDDDILDQLADNVAIAFTLDGKFGLRARVKDPRRFDRTLKRLAKTLPGALEDLGAGTVGYAAPKRRSGAYALTFGGSSIVYRLIREGNEASFVLANDPQLSGRLSVREPEPVSGADGAIVVRADTGRILLDALGESAGRRDAVGLAVRAVAASLGGLTGSLSAETSGVSGSFTLELE